MDQGRNVYNVCKENDCNMLVETPVDHIIDWQIPEDI